RSSRIALDPEFLSEKSHLARPAFLLRICGLADLLARIGNLGLTIPLGVTLSSADSGTVNAVVVADYRVLPIADVLWPDVRIHTEKPVGVLLAPLDGARVPRTVIDPPGLCERESMFDADVVNLHWHCILT